MTDGIQGLDELLAQFKELENMDLVDAEKDGVQVFVDEAKVLVPVDTGALQDSIRVEVEGDLVQFAVGGGNIDYALYVEMGTSKMPAQPFMRPAIDTKQKEALKAIGANLEKQMRRIASG